jgi:predicted acetyltransferase
MLRVTDVDAALLARGWPVDGEVHLDIDDPLLPENSGRRVLRVRGGQPSISPGGSGLLTLNIRALGPLYSGMFRAETLAQLGWISGAAEEVAAAGRLFASPVPWMREMY